MCVHLSLLKVKHIKYKKPSLDGFLFATLGLEPMLKHTVRTKGVPLQSHSRKLSPRYTQLYLLLALWRKLRLKQLPIVFFLVSQQGEPVKKDTFRCPFYFIV